MNLGGSFLKRKYSQFISYLRRTSLTDLITLTRSRGAESETDSEILQSQQPTSASTPQRFEDMTPQSPLLARSCQTDPRRSHQTPQPLEICHFSIFFQPAERSESSAFSEFSQEFEPPSAPKAPGLFDTPLSSDSSHSPQYSQLTHFSISTERSQNVQSVQSSHSLKSFRISEFLKFSHSTNRDEPPSFSGTKPLAIDQLIDFFSRTRSKQALVDSLPSLLSTFEHFKFDENFYLLSKSCSFTNVIFNSLPLLHPKSDKPLIKFILSFAKHLLTSSLYQDVLTMSFLSGLAKVITSENNPVSLRRHVVFAGKIFLRWTHAQRWRDTLVTMLYNRMRHKLAEVIYRHSRNKRLIGSLTFSIISFYRTLFDNSYKISCPPKLIKLCFYLLKNGIRKKDNDSLRLLNSIGAKGVEEIAFEKFEKYEIKRSIMKEFYHPNGSRRLQATIFLSLVFNDFSPEHFGRFFRRKEKIADLLPIFVSNVERNSGKISEVSASIVTAILFKRKTLGEPAWSPSDFLAKIFAFFDREDHRSLPRYLEIFSAIVARRGAESLAEVVWSFPRLVGLIIFEEVCLSRDFFISAILELLIGINLSEQVLPLFERNQHFCVKDFLSFHPRFARYLAVKVRALEEGFRNDPVVLEQIQLIFWQLRAVL